MIVIDTSGNQEMLVDFLDNTVSLEKSIDGTNQLVFTVIKSSKNFTEGSLYNSYDMVREYSKIDLNGELYTIMMVEEGPSSKAVTCVHEFYDNADYFIEDFLPDTVPVKTLNEALNFLFDRPDNQWTFDIRQNFPNRLLVEFGGDNLILLLNQLAEVFGFEFDVQSSNKTVFIRQRLGQATDFQIRYRHNLGAIKRTVDATGVKTRARVFYNPDEQGEYTQNALFISQFENRLVGPKQEKPFYFDGVDVDDALAYVSSQLKQQPTINIEIEFSKLRENNFNEDINLGDSFFLIDERLSFSDEVRIVSITTRPFSNGSPILEITNQQRRLSNVTLQQKINTSDPARIFGNGQRAATTQFVRQYVNSIVNP